MTNSTPVIDTATLAKIEEYYTPSPIPTCAVCGEALVMHGWDEARREVYRCSTRLGYRREDGEGPDEYYRHYDASTFVREQAGDAAVIALLSAYRELAAK